MQGNSLFWHVIRRTSDTGRWDEGLEPDVVECTAATVGVDFRAR